MVQSIEVIAPATVANVGAGFDMMGFAVNHLGDKMILRLNSSDKITISKIEGDDGLISRIPEKNTAGVALIHFMNYLGIKQGVDLEIYKISPIGSGLGSSASSATAAVYGLNELLNKPIKNKQELIPFALEGERLASGGIHADNIAPAMLGGMLLIREVEPLDLIQLPVPAELRTVLIHPNLQILTKDARNLIPKNIAINETVSQMANVGGFIMGLVNNDFALMGRSFKDYLAEPFRAPLITGYHNVKQAALRLGAIGCSISGSGPTVFAFCKNEKEASAIAEVMLESFKSHGVAAQSYISSINNVGTHAA